MNLDHKRRQYANRVRRLRLQSHSLCERSFPAYFRAAWPILEPKALLLENWHQGLIGEYLSAVRQGQIKRLMVNMPPRFSKSSLVTICFPTWFWTTEPGKRFLFFSYAQTLATKHSVDRRSLIESGWYQRGWGERFHLATDQNMKTEFSNDHRGHMIASSMHGGGVGKGGDILVIDDPHDPDHAYRDTTRDNDIRQFDGKIRSRLDNPKTGAIICVMQRLHQKDLSGHCLSTERDAWTWLRLPLIAPKRIQVLFPTSGRKLIREAGDLLHPARIGPAEVESLKKMGEYNFAGQYQQRPSPASGGILKRKWWKYWRALPGNFDRMLISMDCAFKDTEASDYVCIQVWGKKQANCYLIHQVHDRMEFTVTLDALRQVCAEFPDVHEIIVEAKANGDAVISSLKNEIPGIIGFNPRDSKEGRARAVSPWIEAGNVWIPDPEVHPWTGGIVDEAAAFPKGDHDDRVDCMTQALLSFMTTDPGEFSSDLLPDNEQISTTTVPGRNSEDQW